MCYSMTMVKKTQKKSRSKVARFEPDRIFFMIAIVSVLTMVFIGVLVTL